MNPVRNASANAESSDIGVEHKASGDRDRQSAALHRENTAANRFWGAAKGVGGLLESGVGLAAGGAAAWTGVGAAAGALVVLHGADTAAAGLREMLTGAEQESFTEHGLASLLGQQTAELADAGIGVAGTLGVGAFSGLCRSEALVAKTVRWTDRLLPGEGMTGPFGDVLVSRLGTSIDRAQVLLHERVHRFLSPDAFAPFARARASMRSFLYSYSSLFRWGEEALAETVAQVGTKSMTGMSVGEAAAEGLSFPVTNGYVTLTDLGLEAAGAAGKALDAAHSY